MSLGTLRTDMKNQANLKNFQAKNDLSMFDYSVDESAFMKSQVEVPRHQRIGMMKLIGTIEKKVNSKLLDFWL